MDEELLERIEVNPEILRGKPVIKGTRILVTQILEMIANNWTVKEILDSFPELTEKDIKAAILYAKRILEETETYPIPSRR